MGNLKKRAFKRREIYQSEQSESNMEDNIIPEPSKKKIIRGGIKNQSDIKTKIDLSPKPNNADVNVGNISDLIESEPSQKNANVSESSSSDSDSESESKSDIKSTESISEPIAVDKAKKSDTYIEKQPNNVEMGNKSETEKKEVTRIISFPSQPLPLPLPIPTPQPQTKPQSQSQFINKSISNQSKIKSKTKPETPKSIQEQTNDDIEKICEYVFKKEKEENIVSAENNINERDVFNQDEDIEIGVKIGGKIYKIKPYSEKVFIVFCQGFDKKLKRPCYRYYADLTYYQAVHFLEYVRQFGCICREKDNFNITLTTIYKDNMKLLPIESKPFDDIYISYYLQKTTNQMEHLEKAFEIPKEEEK